MNYRWSRRVPWENDFFFLHPSTKRYSNGNYLLSIGAFVPRKANDVILYLFINYSWELLWKYFFSRCFKYLGPLLFDFELFFHSRTSVTFLLCAFTRHNYIRQITRLRSADSIRNYRFSINIFHLVERRLAWVGRRNASNIFTGRETFKLSKWQYSIYSYTC